MSSGPTAQFPGLQTTWRGMLAGGVLFVLLGVLAVLFPYVTSVSLSLLVGALLVVGGLVHVAHAFSARGWKGFAWEAALAVVYTFAGIALLANPVLGLATLTLLVVAYLLVAGVVEIAMGWGLRGESNWLWPTASGVLSLALAALLWFGLPSTAAWAVGLLVGVNLLTTGLSMVVLALGARRGPAEPATGAAGHPEPGNR